MLGGCDYGNVPGVGPAKAKQALASLRAPSKTKKSGTIQLGDLLRAIPEVKDTYDQTLNDLGAMIDCYTEQWVWDPVSESNVRLSTSEYLSPYSVELSRPATDLKACGDPLSATDIITVQTTDSSVSIGLEEKVVVEHIEVEMSMAKAHALGFLPNSLDTKYLRVLPALVHARRIFDNVPKFLRPKQCKGGVIDVTISQLQEYIDAGGKGVTLPVTGDTLRTFLRTRGHCGLSKKTLMAVVKDTRDRLLTDVTNITLFIIIIIIVCYDNHNFYFYFYF